MNSNILDEQIQSLIDEEFTSELKIAIWIEKDAEKRFWERVKIWSDGEDPKEWACIGAGKIQELEDENGEVLTILYVDDFVTLPAYNIYRQHSLTLLLEDIRKVLEHRFPVLMVHTHPGENLEFSPEDKALALLVDEMVGRPLIHMVVNPSGMKKIFHLIHCWDCPHSPLKRERR